MSNALLRDSRVFRVQESDFLMKLNDQGSLFVTVLFQSAHVIIK